MGWQARANGSALKSEACGHRKPEKASGAARTFHTMSLSALQRNARIMSLIGRGRKVTWRDVAGPQVAEPVMDLAPSVTQP